MRIPNILWRYKRYLNYHINISSQPLGSLWPAVSEAITHQLLNEIILDWSEQAPPKVYALSWGERLIVSE